jgi:hypothetical protein
MITPEILKEFIDRFGERIFQACIAEIDSYDKTLATAKVIPLLKVQRESDIVKFPVLSGVPVLDYQAGGVRMIPDLRKGDLVWLAFSSFELSNAIKGQFEFTSDKFAFENCIIIGGLSKQPSVLNPLFNKDGLVITDNQTTYVQIANNKIELSAGSTPSPQKSLLGEDTVQLLKDLIDAINNITVMTPVGPSSPVSAVASNATQLNAIKAQLDSLLSNGVKHN